MGNSISDAVYSFIVWAPLLTLLAAIVLFFTGGMAHFEAMTDGTQYFVPNNATAHTELVTPAEQAAAVQGG